MRLYHNSHTLDTWVPWVPWVQWNWWPAATGVAISLITWSDTCKVVTPADEWNIRTNRNLESYNWFLLPMDPGNGFSWIKSDGFNVIYMVSNQLTKMAYFIPTTTNLHAQSHEIAQNSSHTWHRLWVDLHGKLHKEYLQGAQNQTMIFYCVSSPDTGTGWKIITSGWKLTFGCFVHTNRMIGQIYFWWQSLHTIIIITHWSTQPPSLWTMDITQP